MKIRPTLFAIASIFLGVVQAHAGRWISRDPIQEGSGFVQRDPTVFSPNLYAYVDNDPVNWIDPFGLSKITLNINWTEGQRPDWARSQLQKNVTQLRTYISQCQSQFNLAKDVNVEVKRGGNDGFPVNINITTKPLPGGGDGIVATGDPSGITWNIGDSGSPNILPHELGHGGGYKAKKPGPTVTTGPDGKPKMDTKNTNDHHSNDPENIMWPITLPKNGKVDCEWCNAIQSLAK